MIKTATSSKTRPAVVYILLAVMLVLWTGGAVAHYCFDGLEPPVTLHFDSLSGHDEHDHEPGHVDVEKPALPANLISKIFELNLGFFLIALFCFEMLSLTGGLTELRELSFNLQSPRTLLPPLRAPPANFC